MSYPKLHQNENKAGSHFITSLEHHIHPFHWTQTSLDDRLLRWYNEQGTGQTREATVVGGRGGEGRYVHPYHPPHYFSVFSFA